MSPSAAQWQRHAPAPPLAGRRFFAIPRQSRPPRRHAPGHNPSLMATGTPAQVDIYEVASHLWDTADELRANSHLKAAEYSIPVLGLIFLKFADSRFTEAETDLAGKSSGRRTIGKADYQSRGVLYLPEQARFANLLTLPESE